MHGLVFKQLDFFMLLSFLKAAITFFKQLTNIVFRSPETMGLFSKTI